MLYVVCADTVSIHAPTRGATPPSWRFEAETVFQSTRPHGARHRVRSRLLCSYLGFNPRAHTGRDHRRSAVSDRRAPVSIHAPTRGATTECRASIIE